MSTSSEGTDLLARYLSLRDRGEPRTPAELCADCPERLAELERQIREVESMEGLVLPPDRCSAETMDDSASPPARAIPGYEILAVLGRGGMGVVYKARHLGLNRLVALKMILAGDHASVLQRARFRSEAEAVAQLQHPNIVQIWEVGEHEGRPYFALELVEGGSLDKVLAGQPQPPRAAAALVETLARAVHYAHQQGIIHRDLKPANVLLDFRFSIDDFRLIEGNVNRLHLEIENRKSKIGTPKITDFGLAKRAQEDGPTQTNAVIGTPSYMAPEQAEGNSKQVGTPADIHALGVILYEALTGRVPFQAPSTMAILQRVREDEAVPPRRLRREIPHDLETICLKCLRKQPGQRYASAEALADDLRRFQAGEPILARPIGASHRAWKWARRHPARFAAAALVVLFLVTVPAAGLWLWEERANTALAEERAQKDRYFRNLNLVDREWIAGELEVANQLLDECAVDLRCWEWNFLKRRQEPALLVLKGHAGPNSRVAFSSDGRLVAAAGSDFIVRVSDAATGKLLHKLSGHKGHVGGLAFSPDAGKLYSGGGYGTLRTWDLGNGRPLQTIRDLPAVTSLALDRHGKHLAIGSMGVIVIVRNMETGQEVFRLDLPELEHSDGHVALSADGSHVALSGRDGKEAQVKIWSLATKREVFSWRLARYFQGLAFSELDGTLAVASVPRDNRLPFPREIVIHDWRNKQVLQTLRADGYTFDALAFSANGKLLSVTDYARVQLWDSSNWQELLKLRPGGEIAHAAISPDGSRVAAACADGNLYILDATTEQGVFSVRGHSGGPVNHVLFSPDGRLVASAGADDRLIVWEGATGKTVLSRKHPGKWRGVVRLAFNAEGTCLASVSRAENVLVWSIPQRREIVRLAHAKTVAVAFSPDGKKLATAGYGKTIKIWDVATGKQLWESGGHESWVNSVVFSPDGRTLVTGGGDGTVRCWDVEDFQSRWVCRTQHGEANDLAFSPDGKHIASAWGRRLVTVLNAESGAEVTILRGHLEKVATVAWSPDGRRVASGSDDHTIKVWEPLTGVEVMTLNAHKGAVATVAWDPKGHFLASGSWDKTVKIWDGRPLD